MRLLLDEQLSWPAIGLRLAEDGHDVVSFSIVPTLEGIDDLSLLRFASRERRILVSANGKHFVDFAEELIAEGLECAGLILIPRSINTNNYGTILRGIRSVLEHYDPDSWANRIVWMSR